MKLRLIGTMAAVVLAGVPAGLCAEGPDVGELTRELTGEKPTASRTAGQLDAVYAQVLDALMPDMGSDDVGKSSGPQGTLERIAFQASRPGADADRAACAKALAARLGPDVPAPARVWVLRQIQRIGRAEVVAQVARVLRDKDALVRESARRALRENPSPQANDALQKALASAAPAWRVAVINALADRRDPSNLQALLKEAQSDNDDVRSAAVVGLAKLGEKSAGGAIAAAMTTGSAAARRIATDSYLLLADALADKGDKAAALGIYKTMLPGEGHLKCAGLIGIGRAGGVAELPALFEALADRDIKVRGAGIEALTLMPGKPVADAIAAKARTAGPETKPSLLLALARRGDKGAGAIFLAAAEEADEAVKVEAVRGLGVVGGTTAVPVLLKVAATTGTPQQAARESLQRIEAAGVDRALLAAMNEKDPAIRTEVIRALAARLVTTATPALLKAAQDTDGGVRNEALKALGAVAGTDSLPAVAALLLKAPDDGSRNEAASALARIAGREADPEKPAGPILKALASADGPAKLSLLGVAGRVGGRKLLGAVRAAVKDKDPKVQDAAVRALADWPDAAAADDLLGVAKSAPNETLQVIAIRGFIRVVRMRSDRPAADSAKMLAAGLAAAKRPEEKKQALGALGEVRDILALQAVVPCMADNALKEEAARAAVRIGRDVWSKDLDAAKAAMQKALDASKNDDTRRQAREVLDRIEQKQQEAAGQK